MLWPKYIQNLVDILNNSKPYISELILIIDIIKYWQMINDTILKQILAN